MSCVLDNDAMADKTILITGATNGIGREAAHGLAKTGATIVVHGRDAARTAAVVDAVKAASGNPNVAGLTADLSTLAGMRKLAADFRASYSRLDVLLNNAGALYTARQTTADGLEQTFALNHMSYFVVTSLLRDVLVKSAPARIINVSSGAHMGAKINFDDLQTESGYSPLKVYSQSKLANLLFTFELARQLEGTGVTANALHPGVVRSGFGHNNAGMVGRVTSAVLTLFQRFGGISVEQGADTMVYLAGAPEVTGRTGKYWYLRKETASSAESLERDSQTRLWQISETLMARK